MQIYKKIIFILVFFFSLTVQAALDFSITGDKNISYGETKTFNLNLNPSSSTLKKIINIDLKTSDSSLKVSIKGTNNCVYKNNVLDCPSGVSENAVVAIISVQAPTSNKGDFNLSFSGFSEDDKGIKAQINKKIDIKVVSNVNTLDSIKINSEYLEGFSKKKNNYNLNVGGDVDSVKIEAVLTDNSASFMAGYGPRTVELKHGENVLKIKVISEDGSEKEYVLNINRQDNRKTDSYLTAILVDDKKLSQFNKNKYNYNYVVYNKEKVDITGITSDSKATMEVIGPEKLVAGDNEYQIVVKSEKGDSSTYVVNIENINRKISKKLKSLSLFGYNLKFDKNNNLYKVEYKSEKMSNIELVAVPEEDLKYVKVFISPNINKKGVASKLRPGSKIEVKVVGIDGEEELYTISFKKDSRLNFFFLLIILIIMCLIFYLFKILDKNKNNLKNAKHSKLTKNKELKNKKIKVLKEKENTVEVPEAAEENLEATREISEDFYIGG